MIKRNQEGFTVVELLLAMSFFSFIMLFVIYGFVQINRSYVRGLTVREVQVTARNVIGELGNTIRGVSANDLDLSVPNRLCIGSVRYAWNMVNSDESGFTSETYGDSIDEITLVRSSAPALCAEPILRQPGQNNGDSVSLMDDKLIVQYLDISRIASTSAFRITLVISTDGFSHGDFSQIGENAFCETRKGDQFCDVARLETVVTARN